MIQTKLKPCDGPCGQLKPIWKNQGRKKYCKECWFRMNPPEPISRPTTRIKPVGRKRAKEMDEYSKKRTAFLALNSYCQARLVGCTGIATDIHHKKGRGIYYLNISTWLGVCRNCHDWITENSKEAIEMGLSDSRLNQQDDKDNLLPDTGDSTSSVVL